MKAKTLTLTLLSTTGLLLVVVSVMCSQYGFRFNTSISYPTGLYRLTDASPAYRKGDLVLFCPPDNAVMQMALARDYIKPGTCQGGFTPVIKKVMATGGDVVTFDHQVSINARPVPQARMLPADGEGRPLPSPAPRQLAPDTYLMLSDHRPVVSFDSRYYGPVPAKNVIGHIHPVFTW